MKRLCICEICSCGRHRCPHRPTALYGKPNKTCVLTEYTEKYPAYGGYNPPQSLKPKPVNHGDQGRMDGTTTFKTDFIPYEVTRRPGKQQAEYKPKPGDIDLGTTYKQDYTLYEVHPFAPSRPRERVRATGHKMDTVPTYKEDFRQWEMCKRELKKPDLSYHPPDAKFDGHTTFQDDFLTRGLAPRESFKPSSSPKMSDAPFDCVTSNQQCYVPHPLEARWVKAPEPYRPSSQPLQDLTTNRRDYQGLPGQLPQSYKPNPGKVTSDIPFQSSTEFKERFQQWPVSLPQLHKSLQYVSPTEHMDMSTTSGADYVRHNIQPFISAKPFNRPNKSSAPFQVCTTMRDDYQPWEVKRQAMIKKPEEMQRATGRMDYLSTFKAHFTPHELQPSVSFKPAHAPMRTDAPLEGGTMYSTEFTPKRISICPASYDSPPGFVFEDSDDRGHRFYRKLPSKDRNKMAAGMAVAVVS
ncbi:stabilizer of axonemal microtubules 2 isoform X1 [Coregonus clupeaformis]|uniref:stabilizer of axonemal microtubules 2 isoform X1 n=1 Tax=Coregonus clupeaformis TaxID=59861 RepID=UPI001E1C82E0|nr:stabilizer of axonemal microtubules 2 isoform X1 [Coregonus clupeaformis]